MVNNKTRFIAAPVTALALAMSTLAVPAASALEVTQEAETCSISVTPEDSAFLTRSHVQALQQKYEAYEKVSLAYYPDLAPVLKKYKGAEPESAAWWEGMRLIEKAFAEGQHDEDTGRMAAYYMLTDTAALVAEANSFQWNVSGTYSKDQALAKRDAVLEQLGFPGDENPQVLDALSKGEYQRAREIATAAYQWPVLDRAQGAKLEFYQRVYARFPKNEFDRELTALALLQACVDGKSMNTPAADAFPATETPVPDSPLKPGTGSTAGGSDMGSIFGWILGLGAIGALLGGIYFWAQQQGWVK